MVRAVAWDGDRLEPSPARVANANVLFSVLLSFALVRHPSLPSSRGVGSLSSVRKSFLNNPYTHHSALAPFLCVSFSAHTRLLAVAPVSARHRRPPTLSDLHFRTVHSLATAMEDSQTAFASQYQQYSAFDIDMMKVRAPLSSLPPAKQELRAKLVEE